MDPAFQSMFNHHLHTVQQHFGVVIETLAAPPYRPTQLRVAERSLVYLEQAFSEYLSATAQKWLEAAQHLKILWEEGKRLKTKELNRRAITKRINTLEQALQKFYLLPHEDRLKLTEIGQQVHLLVQELETHPSLKDLLLSYHSFLELKPLHPYLNQPEELANWICDAKILKDSQMILDETSLKISFKKEKLKEKKQALYILGGLSVFLVTVPLTIPLIINTWLHKKVLIEDLKELQEQAQNQKNLVESGQKGIQLFQHVKGVLQLSDLEDLQEKVKTLFQLKSLMQQIEFHPTLKNYDLIMSVISKYPQFFHLDKQDPLDLIKKVHHHITLIMEQDDKLEKLKLIFQEENTYPEDHEEKIHQAIHHLQGYLDIQDEEDLQSKEEVLRYLLTIEEQLPDARKMLSLIGKNERYIIDYPFLSRCQSLNNRLKMFTAIKKILENHPAHSLSKAPPVV